MIRRIVSGIKFGDYLDGRSMRPAVQEAAAIVPISMHFT